MFFPLSLRGILKEIFRKKKKKKEIFKVPLVHNECETSSYHSYPLIPHVQIRCCLNLILSYPSNRGSKDLELEWPQCPGSVGRFYNVPGEWPPGQDLFPFGYDTCHMRSQFFFLLRPARAHLVPLRESRTLNSLKFKNEG